MGVSLGVTEDDWSTVTSLNISLLPEASRINIAVLFTFASSRRCERSFLQLFLRHPAHGTQPVWSLVAKASDIFLVKSLIDAVSTDLVSL